MADTAIAGLTYERALEELDGLISQLEAGRIDLEEALTCYERGTRLATHCQDLLDRTEAKVSKVVLGGGGRIEERPLDIDAAEPPGTGAVEISPAGRRGEGVFGDAGEGSGPRRARSAPVLFPGYEPPEEPASNSLPPIDPEDVPF